MHQDNAQLKETVAEGFIEAVRSVVKAMFPELKEQIKSELREQIKSELREELQQQARLADSEVQQEIARQAVIRAGLG